MNIVAASGSIDNGSWVHLVCKEFDGQASMTVLSGGITVAYYPNLTGRTRAGDIVLMNEAPHKVLTAAWSTLVSGARTLTLQAI